MPSSFTHYLVGRSVCALLPFPFSTPCEVGCQGGDFAFFLPSFSRKNNLGRVLHRGDPYAFFSRLASYCFYRPETLSYALGYLTHYATDVCFHPYIYRTIRKGLSHAALESVVDAYFLRKEGRASYRIPVNMLSQKEREDIARLYLEISDRRVTAKGFASACRALDLISRRVLPMLSNRQEETERDSKKWEELLSRSVSLSLRLASEFLPCAQNGGELSKNSFMRDFSGKIF